MQSPIHPGTAMELKEIEPDLFAYTCPKSEGIWIPLQRYLDWKSHHRDTGSSLPMGYTPTPADDSKRRVLICPESGRLLSRYGVGHGLKFQVDVSPVTGGIWLDQGEWEALKSKGIHVELNLVFSASYQRQIRTAEYELALERTFAERIGAEDFQIATAFKRWLAAHPNRRDICCYVLHNLEE